MKIQIYDPALCCSTGVCGTEVDAKLVAFAADFAWAKQQRGAQIERFNLAQNPMAFAESPMAKGFLERFGADALPLVVIDGEIAVAGRYPTRTELARWLGVTPPSPFSITNSGCTPGGGCC